MLEVAVSLLTLLFVLALGSSVGSFLNVVIYRLPAGLSLLHPPSRCPHCLHPLGKTENIPILGWLWLRGRCRWCQVSISPRYPWVEALTGIIFCSIFQQFGATTQTLGYWILSGFLISLALIDWDTMILPGVLTKTGLIVGLLFQGLWGWQAGHLGQGIIDGTGGAVLGLWLFDLLRWGGTLWLKQEAMGDGDPKLAALLGAWLGWQLLFITTFFACLLALVAMGMAIALGHLQHRQGFPFGPWLSLGGLISVLAGEFLIQSYQNLFFPSF